MTPRTFWTVVIKIIGICIAYQLLVTVWRSLNIAVTYMTMASYIKEYNSATDIYITLATALTLLLIYILLFYVFVFKTVWVVDKLKLDKGYENELFEFNIHYSTILRVVISIIGGLLLVNIIPSLVEEVFFHFQKTGKYTTMEHNRNIVYIIADAIKILIGLCMIIYTNGIVNFITRKSKKDIVEVREE